MNQRYNQPIVAPIVALIVVPIQIKHVHSSLSYQWAIYQRYNRVVMDRLVAMGLKGGPDVH